MIVKPKRNDIDDIKKTVEYILRTKPQTRNDDFILISEVYKRLGIQNFHNLDYIAHNHKRLRLPPFETITRARRKLQQEHEELKACDIVTIARSNKEKEYRELFKK